MTVILVLITLGSYASALESWTPDLILTVDADIPYQGAYAGGEAYVYLGTGHADIENPVIVVEGFDPENSRNAQELFGLLNQENLIEDLRAEGYDAIILNFDEGADYIQKNAMLLVKLIQLVQDRISQDMDMIVIGASMGGLVSRYALVYMEDQVLDHRVRTFISFDSPQLGANIPLGIQEFINFWANRGAEVAEDGRAVLNSPAARQMLIYHFGQSGAGPDAQRVQLLQDLAELGDFPDYTRNVAIANGSGHTLGLDYAPGTEIITWNHSLAFLTVTSKVWALPGQPGTNPVFEGDFAPLGGLGRKTSTSTVPAGTPSWDNAPGGLRDTAAELAGPVEVDFQYDPGGILPPVDYSYNLGVVNVNENLHCFIPTVSALYFDTQDPFYMVCVDPDNLLAASPFDAVYFPLYNQAHVQVTAENKVWFMDEIQGTVSAVLPGPLAVRVELRDAFPNPFNPMTNLAFNLPEGGWARLEIYDIMGRRVRTLESGFFNPGEHLTKWNGVDSAGLPVGSGLYFCRMTTENGIDTRSITLVK